MKRAALYCRVSTEEQARHGLSIESQETALRAFADRNEYKIVDLYRDAGISARKPYNKRPEFCRMLEDIKADKVDIVLFTKLDRFFRNVSAYYQAMPTFEEHNVVWQATEEQYSTATASDRFKVNLFLAIAEDEADRTSERIKFVFQDKRNRNETLGGQAPIGMRKSGKLLEPDPETSHIVAELFQRFIDTRSVTATNQWLLNTYQIVRDNVGVRWILKNRKYVDYGIVSASTWERVQEIYAQHKPRQSRGNTVYLFGGLCYCKHCGAKMTARTDNSGVIRYNCSAHDKKRCENSRTVRESLIESELLSSVLGEANRFNVKLKQKQKKPATDVTSLKRKQSKLLDLYMNDLIEKDEYETKYRDLQNAILSANKAVENPIDVSYLEGVLNAYNALTIANKAVFWHRILNRIEIDENRQIFLQFTSPS